MKKSVLGFAGAVVLIALSFVFWRQGNSVNPQKAQVSTTKSASEGCTTCDHGSDQVQASAAQYSEDGEYMGKVDANGKAAGPSLMAAYKADTLYTCPMHPEIITDNPNARCPLCGMNLKQMPDGDVQELRASHPKGCPMDPVVYPGDSEAEKCNICGMDLMDPSKSHGGMQGHESMQGS